MSETLNQEILPERSLSTALINGARSKCPNCGEGPVFNGFLDIVDECETCGEALHHHRADDLPPYLNIFIVGHIVVAFLLLAVKYEWFDTWTITFGGAGIALISAIVLMRPLKGMVVGLQWALRMHGFDGSTDQE